jgi:hypothetical protein
LALMGQLIEGNGAAWGYSRPLWVTTDGIVVPYCTNLTLADEMKDFLARNTIPATCVAHTRDALEAAGFWPEDVPSAADWVLWKRTLGMSGYRPAYLPQPTNLHFSADWKQSRFAGVIEVETLARIAESASWWPTALRHPPAAEPEQATLWRAMANGGAAMVADIRAATETVIDRIAWSATRDLKPALEAALAAKQPADARAEALRQELTSARASAEAAALQGEANAEALRRKLLAAEQKASAAARREERAASELAAAKRRIQDLKASPSWRATAPLRELFRLARRLRLVAPMRAG